MELELANVTTVIAGGIDEVVEPLSLYKKILGHRDEVLLADAYSYIYLSNNANGALASLEVDIRSYTYDKLEAYLKMKEDNSTVAFSNQALSQALKISDTLHVKEYGDFEFETKVLYIIDQFLKSDTQKITIIENSLDEYMLIEINKMI